MNVLAPVTTLSHRFSPPDTSANGVVTVSVFWFVPVIVPADDVAGVVAPWIPESRISVTVGSLAAVPKIATV